MRIGIIGDTHFGFGNGTERGDDSFEEASRAIRALVAEKPDFVILPGDVFDSAVPRQETLARAAETIRILSFEGPTGAKVFANGIERPLAGIPIIAIHGTHERRPKGLTNPLQVIDKAGVLCYIHGEGATVRKGEEAVYVFGIGGVPEEYFPFVLKNLSPKPESGMKSVFVFHQNVLSAIPGIKDGIELSALPPGFDLYIDGHIHWGIEEKKPPEGKPVIFSGSTITTQVRRGEAFKDKAVWVFDTENSSAKRIPFAPFRKVFLVEAESVKEAIGKVASLDFPQGTENAKPILKVKIKSSGAPEEISGIFSDKFLLSIEFLGDEKSSGPGTDGQMQGAREQLGTIEERTTRTLHSLLLGAIPKERLEKLYSLLSCGKEAEAKEEVLSIGSPD